MTEYRTQAEGPPPAIDPARPLSALGTRDNPLPFSIVKKCPLCGEKDGFFTKEAVKHKDGTLLWHRHRGGISAPGGCDGEWYTRTALAARGAALGGERWPWRRFLIAVVGGAIAGSAIVLDLLRWWAR